MRFKGGKRLIFMFKNHKYYFLLVIFALIFNLLFFHCSLAAIIKAPIIIEIDQGEAKKLARPLITGLTQLGTEVMIYIDGEYVGLAEINRENTKTDNFYFQLAKALSAGQHTVTAIAQDRTSLVLSPLSEEFEFYIPSLPAPTLIKPNEQTVTGKVKPLITGLTVNGSLAHIYIDGVYNGKTEILTHSSGTANFAYVPFLNLGVGQHTAWAIAEDESGRKSQISNVLNFRIEEPLPAPTLFTPVVNKSTNYQQPFIVGLAKNNSLIKVYIDKQLNGQFQVENHQSGTANFAFQPFSPLAEGNHLVYTEAVDSRGKVSCWSNIVYFRVARSIQPTITEKAAEEAKEEIKVLSETLSEEAVQPIGELKKEEAVTEGIEEFIQPSESEEAEETGLIDESKERQGKLKWNLIIFILFLVAVIAWIFWVNRELIKERRIKNIQDKDKK